MITLDQIKAAVLWDESICISCGEVIGETLGLRPPTVDLHCPACGSEHVVLAATALLLIETVEDE